MARRKAYAARMVRTTTLEFQKRTSEGPYTAQRDVANILALSGGVPILVGTEVIGGGSDFNLQRVSVSARSQFSVLRRPILYPL